MQTVVCNRCGGSGQTSFYHIADGICFACNGTGYVYVDNNNCDLSIFIKQKRSDFSSKYSYRMITSCKEVNKGGIFIAKKENGSIILWNQRAGANWCFIVPVGQKELLKRYFEKL